MLKKTITYVDFNDQPQTEDLYFNLSKTEILDMQHLQPRIEAWTNKIVGPERELTIEEALEMLDIIKLLVQLSYGVRSADGKRFAKSDELFKEFTQTAAYDVFIMSLLETGGQEAINFMTGILPKDILEQVNSEGTATVELPKDEAPAYIRENRNPTSMELQSMTPAQLQEAFARKIQNTES